MTNTINFFREMLGKQLIDRRFQLLTQFPSIKAIRKMDDEEEERRKGRLPSKVRGGWFHPLSVLHLSIHSLTDPPPLPSPTNTHIHRHTGRRGGPWGGANNPKVRDAEDAVAANPSDERLQARLDAVVAKNDEVRRKKSAVGSFHPLSVLHPSIHHSLSLPRTRITDIVC